MHEHAEAVKKLQLHAASCGFLQPVGLSYFFSMKVPFFEEKRNISALLSIITTKQPNIMCGSLSGFLTVGTITLEIYRWWIDILPVISTLCMLDIFPNLFFSFLNDCALVLTNNSYSCIYLPAITVNII
ncbi:uncharacterized protein ZBAI_03575 [Zygosaccharomyces bailii ISA1307]|nr:uncharacterized protein ZBAI_03575 [Zygosaccharomyces bailii ISA1307]